MPSVLLLFNKELTSLSLHLFVFPYDITGYRDLIVQEIVTAFSFIKINLHLLSLIHVLVIL